MAVIGNSSTQQAFTPAIDYFSGNASTTAFTLSRPVASVAQVQVTINNVAQNPSTAFTVSSNTITFTSAPSSGTNNIYVYYTSPITQVIAPGQGTVTTTSLASSTGTGAVVLATSPTITTPTISGTGLVTGTLNLGSIGSGGGTAGQLFFGGVSGSIDGFDIDNQNGNYLRFKASSTASAYMVMNNSGSVGIGTTSPNKQLTTTSTTQIGTPSATDATTINGTSIAINRDVDNGAIFNSAGGAFQFQHTKSTTLTNDLLDLQVYSYTGTSQTSKAMTVNGIGNITIPGCVIQTQWTDMGSTNAQGTNSTPVYTGFNKTFTPKFSTSQVLHIIVIGMYFICDGRFYIGKSGSVVSPSLGDSSRVAYDWYNDIAPTTVTWIDTPGTTSTITYQIFAAANGCGNTWAVGSSSDFQWSWTMMEIGV